MRGDLWGCGPAWSILHFTTLSGHLLQDHDNSAPLPRGEPGDQAAKVTLR